MSSAREQRARWRSRRGMLELDVLLNKFIDVHYAKFDVVGQDEFDDLLEQSDVDLYAWFTGRREPSDSSTRELVERIRKLSE